MTRKRTEPEAMPLPTPKDPAPQTSGAMHLKMEDSGAKNPRRAANLTWALLDQPRRLAPGLALEKQVRAIRAGARDGIASERHNLPRRKILPASTIRALPPDRMAANAMLARRRAQAAVNPRLTIRERDLVIPVRTVRVGIRSRAPAMRARAIMRLRDPVAAAAAPATAVVKPTAGEKPTPAGTRAAAISAAQATRTRAARALRFREAPAAASRLRPQSQAAGARSHAPRNHRNPDRAALRKSAARRHRPRDEIYHPRTGLNRARALLTKAVPVATDAEKV